MTCFIIAMDSEAEPVIATMKHVKKRIVCGRRIIVGTLFKSKVAVVVCGVGKVNAACGAQYAVDKLGADVIINIGVAGGLDDDLKVGDVFEISHAVQYDFDISQLNGKPVGTLDGYDENYIALDIYTKYPAKKLATGDRFNDDKDDLKLLTEILKADIRDMEGGAIAQVCKSAGVKCHSIKIISDVAGSGSTTEQYRKNLNHCLKKLKNEIVNIAYDL